MLHLFRPFKERLLFPLGEKLSETSPNTVTIFSLFPGLLAGVAWWIGGWGFLVAASVLTLLNGFLDLLDGHMARHYNRMSALGDFLDCIVDRYTDVAILMGIGFSPYANPLLAHLAIVAVLLVSFLGTQSQASGGVRVEGGILGRAERHVLLILIPYVQIVSDAVGVPYWGRFTPVEWLLVVLVVFGHATAFYRIREGINLLKDAKTGRDHG